MSLSTSSAPSVRSASTSASVLSSSELGTAGAGGPRVAGSSLPGAAVTHASTTPGWRTVGEKSALRGYLAVLGVTTEASISDIRGAYKKLALQWHPDRSDAPNARMKFQELSQAYMALCCEEGDAQEIDVGLYEREAAEAAEEISYLGGMAGVTSGLAGVFCGVGLGGPYSPLFGLNGAFKPTTDSQHRNHLDLYRNALSGVKTKLAAPHSLSCTCHAHSTTPQPPQQQQPQTQLQQAAPCPANCQCHAHTGDSKSSPVGPSSSAANAASLSELDIASAVAADISLLTGVLAPPVIAVGDANVQIRIAPLANPPAPVVYQIQLKIKSKYQLVYQGSALSYSIPVASNAAAAPPSPFYLLPGTRYMIRVRACPAALQTRGRRASLTGGESDDELLDAYEIPTDATDEATGLGLFSQPTTVTTQGTKPDGNTPHPPVLSNIQLAALRKKEAKGKGKKPIQQAKATAHNSSTPDDADPSVHTSTTPHSNSSTPGKTSRTLESKPAAPSSPSLLAAAATTATTVAAASPAPSQSAATLSKKEAKLRAKQAEEDRKRAEAELEAQRRVEEEVAYQKFLLEARAQAERTRLQEEQEELERYAKLKLEQDAKAAQRKADEEATQKQGNKRNAKKNQNQQQKASEPASAKETPPTPQQGRRQKAAAVAALSPSKVAAAPIMHIKLSPEQQAAIKAQQQQQQQSQPPASKEPLLATPADKSGRKGRESKAAQASAVAAAIVAATPTKSAWGSPVTKQQASPSATAAANAPTVAMSPIILNRPKLPGAKAWALPAEPQSTQQQQSASAGLMPLSLAASATPAPASLPSDSLSEHLHRFDANKPWQADLLAQQQPSMLESMQLSDLLLMQQQQSSFQQQRLDSARFSQHMPAFASQHASTPFSATLPQTLSSVAWAEDDLLLSDLQDELERERWNSHGTAVPRPASPNSAAAEAAWNSTANTTVPSHSLLTGTSSSLPLFAPLSSLLSDYSDTAASTAFASPRSGASGVAAGGSAMMDHDDILLPAQPSAAATGFFAATSQQQPQQRPSTPPQSTYSNTASTSTANSLLSYSNLNSFPTTSGLSRDAPSFNPMSSASSSLPPLAAPLESSIGHTRLPLPATGATSSSAVAPALSGIFNSFALPSFSSFSSFGAQATTSGAGLDWSTHSTSSASSLNPSVSASSSLAHSHLHDDSLDADHLFRSIPALAADAQDDVLVPGTLRPKW